MCYNNNISYYDDLKREDVFLLLLSTIPKGQTRLEAKYRDSLASFGGRCDIGEVTV